MTVPPPEPPVEGNRPWLFALVFLLLPLRLAAAPAITLDIPIFAGGFGTAFFEATARRFEQERPHVRVNLYGDPRISDKIRVRVIDGNLPDAMLPHRLLIPALARNGRLLALEPFLDEPNWEGDARWGDTFRPGSLEGWVVDNRAYGVPFAYACWALFYNRTLFREHGWTEPRTWEDFFALCAAIEARLDHVAPFVLTGIYGSYSDAVLRAAYYNLAGAAGWRALNDLEPGAYSDPRYVRAAGVLQRLTQRHTLRGWEGMTHTGAQLAFLDGRAAMTVSGSWMLNEMAGKVPSALDIGVMNFPVFPDGAADPTAIQTGADYFFLFATGRPDHERAAVDFLKFLTSRERARAFVREIGSPVAVRGIPREAFPPAMREVADLIDRARESYLTPQATLQPPAIRQTLLDQRQLLILGQMTPERFAARVEEAAARDRQRLADPRRVEYRHPIAGSILLALVAGSLGWLASPGIRAARKKRLEVKPLHRDVPTGSEIEGRPSRRRTPALPVGEGYFGPLRARMGLVFVGPAFLLYAAFVLAPGTTALGWSFLNWDGLGEKSWAGLFQFKQLLFEHDGFWPALGNNVFLMLVPAAAVVPLALLFAALFHRGVWGAGVFRVVFLFPNLLGGIAAALLWLNAYEPHGGLVNATLVGAGRLLGSPWLLSFDDYPWLAPENLYPSLVPIYIWMACGFNLVLYLAAMEGVDPQLYEAAEIDGIPKWRQFFSITLPLIRDVIVISAVFLVIAGLNAFEMIWLLTSQDPSTSTHTLGTLMVTSMFQDFDIGRATAIAVILFVLVLTASALLLRTWRREVVE